MPERPSWEALFAAVARDPDDDEPWSALYSSLWPYFVDFVVSRYGLDAAAASDVVQDATVQYRRKLCDKKIAQPSLRHVHAFVRYCVLNVLRAQARLVELDSIVPPVADGDPERDLLQKLIVDEALERMDQRCAYVLRAKYFQGRTGAEIAKALGLEESHVRVLLHRCREQCRALVETLVPAVRE